MARFQILTVRYFMVNFCQIGLIINAGETISEALRREYGTAVDGYFTADNIFVEV